jgi:hypothetical protein
MKLYGYLKGKGKLGNMVVSTVAGETIARDYNPNVANPSTSAQVNQRARMKLMSQLSAAFAPVIAIPKDGLKSSRNLFSKKNFPLTFAANGMAQISYENIQLTDGNTGLPTLNVSRSTTDNLIAASLVSDPGANVSKVVYILYKKSSEQRLQYVASAIASRTGDSDVFNCDLPFETGDVIVYAYGIKDTGANASGSYGNYVVNNAEDVAQLVGTRSVAASGMAMTQTHGVTLLASESSHTPTPDGSSRVYVTANGNGTVSGAGTFTNGSQVTVTATPASGSTFQGWKLQGQQGFVSTSASYTFTIQQQTDLIAYFYTPEGGGDVGQN